MAKRYLVLSYMLLQGLSIIAMDNADGAGNKLRSSGDSLRRSTDKLSKSQELKKEAARAIPYFDGCGGWIANNTGRNYSMSRALAPVTEEYRYRCP